MARPTKLNKPLIASLIAHLKRGVPQRTACLLVGLSESGLHKWKNHANTVLAKHEIDGSSHPKYAETIPKRDQPFVEFMESVESARAEAEVRMIEIVRKHAVAGDVKAAQWWLDRAYPERWAARQRLEVVGADDGPVTIRVEYEPGDDEKEMPAA